MNFEQYLARRNELLNKLREINGAEAFDQAAFDEIKAQITALDSEWEARCQANADIEAINGVQPRAEGVIDLSRNAGEEMPAAPTDIYDTVEYRQAFMNYVCHGEATVVSTNRVLYGVVFSSSVTLRRSWAGAALSHIIAQ